MLRDAQFVFPPAQINILHVENKDIQLWLYGDHKGRV